MSDHYSTAWHISRETGPPMSDHYSTASYISRETGPPMSDHYSTASYISRETGPPMSDHYSTAWHISRETGPPMLDHYSTASYISRETGPPVLDHYSKASYISRDGSTHVRPPLVIILQWRDRSFQQHHTSVERPVFAPTTRFLPGQILCRLYWGPPHVHYLSVASVGHTWWRIGPWSHDQPALEQRLLWLCSEHLLWLCSTCCGCAAPVVAVQHLLWLCRLMRESQSLSQRLHLKVVSAGGAWRLFWRLAFSSSDVDSLPLCTGSHVSTYTVNSCTSPLCTGSHVHIHSELVYISSLHRFTCVHIHSELMYTSLLHRFICVHIHSELMYTSPLHRFICVHIHRWTHVHLHMQKDHLCRLKINQPINHEWPLTLISLKVMRVLGFLSSILRINLWRSVDILGLKDGQQTINLHADVHCTIITLMLKDQHPQCQPLKVRWCARVVCFLICWSLLYNYNYYNNNSYKALFFNQS